MYNWGLHTRSVAYRERGERLYYNDLAAMLPDLKKAYPWLGEVSSVPIQQSLRHLDKAFKHFFEGRAKYPTFKKKQNSQSATYASNAFKWDGVSLSANSNTNPSGTDEPWSRLTGSIPLAKHAARVSTC